MLPVRRNGPFAGHSRNDQLPLLPRKVEDASTVPPAGRDAIGPEPCTRPAHSLDLQERLEVLHVGSVGVPDPQCRIWSVPAGCQSLAVTTHYHPIDGTSVIECKEWFAARYHEQGH